MNNSSQYSSSKYDVRLTPAQESVLTKKYLKIKKELKKGEGLVASTAEEFIGNLNKD